MWELTHFAENPYQVSQDFIHRHELPQDYLDQIATFLIDNSKGVTLGTAAPQNVSDPYTGKYYNCTGKFTIRSCI